MQACSVTGRWLIALVYLGVRTLVETYFKITNNTIIAAQEFVHFAQVQGHLHVCLVEDLARLSS